MIECKKRRAHRQVCSHLLSPAAFPSVTHLLAHCHPTDDPGIRGPPQSRSCCAHNDADDDDEAGAAEPSAPRKPAVDLDALTERLFSSQVGSACIMSTNTQDQHLVRGIAERARTRRRGQIVPAFGHHPWFTHWISTSSSLDESSTSSKSVRKEQHYRRLFPDPPLLSESVSELDLILPHLPDPVPLERILDELQSNLEAHPEAILGEVGIDRSFRLPFPAASYDELERLRSDRPNPAPPPQQQQRDSDSYKPAPRHRLSRLQTPLAHQLEVLHAQLAVAIRLRRAVSFHSVRAAGATADFLQELCTARFPRALALPSPDSSTETSRGASFHGSVHLALHSCTLSAPELRKLQAQHPNVYVSFSTTINARQKALREQIDAADPRRLLSESDWCAAEGLAQRVREIVALFAQSASVRRHVGLTDADGEEESFRRVVRMLRSNWTTFLRNREEVEAEEEVEEERRIRKHGR